MFYFVAWWLNSCSIISCCQQWHEGIQELDIKQNLDNAGLGSFVSSTLRTSPSCTELLIEVILMRRVKKRPQVQQKCGKKPPPDVANVWWPQSFHLELYPVLVTASAGSDLAILFGFQLVPFQILHKFLWKRPARAGWEVRWEQGWLWWDQDQPFAISARIRFALFVLLHFFPHVFPGVFLSGRS